ncbi:MAG: hypothetical protein OHK0046_12710 [Anaerolineae bacterium]
MTAQIISITYKPVNQKQANPPDHFLRVPVERANLIENHGIEGDRKAGHPERQINIMSLATLEKLAEEGYKVAPGEMGEQIIVSGLDISALPSGSQLQLGESAVLELVKPRNGCDRFITIQGKTLPGTGELGMIARVVAGGEIFVGAPVMLKETKRV